MVKLKAAQVACLEEGGIGMGTNIRPHGYPPPGVRVTVVEGALARPNVIIEPASAGVRHVDVAPVEKAGNST